MRLLCWFALLAAVATAGCSKEKNDAPENPEPVGERESPDKPDKPELPDKPDEPGEQVPVAACDTLDRAECISSLHCTMHWVSEGTYECRPSKGPCEENLMQSDKGACESRDGCAWSPGKCYCPFPGYGRTQVPDKQKNPGGACACGGGPPAMCAAPPAK